MTIESNDLVIVYLDESNKIQTVKIKDAGTMQRYVEALEGQRFPCGIFTTTRLATFTHEKLHNYLMYK